MRYFEIVKKPNKFQKQFRFLSSEIENHFFELSREVPLRALVFFFLFVFLFFLFSFVFMLSLFFFYFVFLCHFSPSGTGKIRGTGDVKHLSLNNTGQFKLLVEKSPATGREEGSGGGGGRREERGG